MINVQSLFDRNEDKKCRRDVLSLDRLIYAVKGTLIRETSFLATFSSSTDIYKRVETLLGYPSRLPFTLLPTVGAGIACLLASGKS